MNKLEVLVDGDWINHSHLRVFLHEQNGGERLRVGVPAQSAEPLLLLLELMPEPLILLYVLHTPRKAEPGRYQSPYLGRTDVEAFLDRFADYLAGDARHDLWVRSPEADTTLVWDRHDVLFVYGGLIPLSSALIKAGYVSGSPSIAFPHRHNYHPAFDSEQHALLQALDWYRTDLQPADYD